MTEEELRALVRVAIARVRGGATVMQPVVSPLAGGRVLSDAAHAMFVIPDGADEGGPCIIEPAVPCNHCGYCKSMGH